MKLRAKVAVACLLALAACAEKKAAPPPKAVEQPLPDRPAPRGGMAVAHRVAPGETWASIARDFYGDAKRAGDLASRNGAEVERPPRAGSSVQVPFSADATRSMDRRLIAVRQYNAGLDLTAGGNHAEAAERYREALEIDPEFTDASFNLAVSCQKLSLHRQAIPILRGLISRAPRDVRFRYALGVSLFSEGDLGGARKAFAEVLDLDRGNLKALFSLAVVCEKEGRLDEARRRFREYLDLDPAGEWAESARAHLDALGREGEGR